MPARPSSSGGPNGKASAFLGLDSNSTAANRRISRDDMSLPSATRSKKGLQPYRIGIVRGNSLSHSDVSLVRNHQPYSLPSSISTATIESDPTGPSSIPIGMALGSPAHPPEVHSTQWQPQTHPPPRPVTPPPLAYPASVPAVQRQKSQRRKLFGGLFGSRKHVEQAKPTHELGGFIDSLPTRTIPVSGQREKAPARSKTVVDRKPSKHKPTMSRSNSEPVVDTPRSGARDSTERKSQGWRPLIPDKTNNHLSPMPSASSDQKRACKSPLLDVEIPDITLERYSVMFGSLLDSEASSSSLLARRQATLERLRTIKEGASGEEEKERLRHRRATSPQPMNSPAF